MVTAIILQALAVKSTNADGVEMVHNLKPNPKAVVIPRWVRDADYFKAAENSGWARVTSDTPDGEDPVVDPLSLMTPEYQAGYAAGLAAANQEIEHSRAEVVMITAQQNLTKDQPGKPLLTPADRGTPPAQPFTQGSGVERYSSYTQGWDKGFSQENDPYGILSEYIVQSPNPDAAKPVANLPTQGDANEVAAKAQAEDKARKGSK